MQFTTESLPSLWTYSGEMMQPVDMSHQEKSYQLPCLVVKGTGLLGTSWNI